MAKPLTYTPHSHDGEPGQGAPQATSAASLPLMRFLGGAICCGRTVARDKQAGDPSITLAIAPSNSVLTLTQFGKSDLRFLTQAGESVCLGCGEIDPE